MKTKNIILASFVCLGLCSFVAPSIEAKNEIEIEANASSFTLINDTKSEVSIHTGTGFVSLNKGSKTSIGCNVGKNVSWAENGKKTDVIFEITDDMCGTTIKLSKYVK